MQRMTAAHLLSESLASQKMAADRQEIANKYAATTMTMSDYFTRSVQNIQDHMFLRPKTYPIDRCLAIAAENAIQDQNVVFISSDIQQIANTLAQILQKECTSSNSFSHAMESVRLIKTNDLREIVLLLQKMEESFQLQSKSPPKILIVGPICTMILPYRTKKGLNIIGHGLMRLIDLEIKRFSSQYNINILIAKPNI